MYDEMLTAIVADAATATSENDFLGMDFCSKYCKSLGYKSDKQGYKQCKAECRQHKKEIKTSAYSIPPSSQKALEEELRKPLAKKGLSGFNIGLIIFGILLLLAVIAVAVRRMRNSNK